MNKITMELYAKYKAFTNLRYVNTFVPVFQQPDNTFEEPKKSHTTEVLKLLEKCAENIQNMEETYPFIKELNEVLYLKVMDLGSIKITVKIDKGTITVEEGWDINANPSFVIPLYSYNIKHLVEMTKDKTLDISDAYRLTRVLFIPFLQSLYNGNYTNLPKDKAYMELDNFIQVEVTNEQNINVEGFDGNAKATVVNVDGQWLVFEGFQGDPDIRYTMSIEQALKFAYILRVELPKTKKTSELKRVVKKYNDLKKETKTYERKWHNIEEYEQ